MAGFIWISLEILNMEKNNILHSLPIYGRLLDVTHGYESRYDLKLVELFSNSSSE